MTKTFKKLRLGIKEAHSVDDITRAVEIAKKSSGNYSGATKEIEKIAKGLSDHPKVKGALFTANEQYFSHVGRDVSQKLSYDNWLKQVKGIEKGVHGTKGDEHTKLSKQWRDYKKEEVELDEGKYTQYSSLLVQKGKLLAKGFIPQSITVTRINKEIDKEKKKLGIEEDLKEGRMKELHTLIQQGKSAEEIAKIMKLDVKTVKSLMPKENVDEVSPPGWGGSVKAMKKHADIDNPYALAWHMKNKGDKPHYKDKDGAPVKKDKYKDEQMEQVKEQSYKDKFNAALKHFSINSIGDLKSDEEKKKFFNYVDSKHKADNEEVKKEETNMKKEDHDCAKVHPDKPHQEWEKDNLKKAQYETHKYFDTKPGSIEDSINKVNELEEASVTINKKEIDDLVKQYIAKGGIVTKLPPALKPNPDETPPKEWDLALGKFVPGSKQGQIAYKVKKVGSGYKILKAQLREFIKIYNEHFLTTYAAEEFIVKDRLNEKEKEKEEGAMKRGKHLDTFKPKPKEK